MHSGRQQTQPQLCQAHPKQRWTALLAGDLAADMNGDGLLDNGDIGTLASLFLAGC